ncbi:MAG: helicase-associated domain-containing protein [Treponema sp.]|nr:helicase-associated domain-containing protein [Treponema sp.]
MNSINHWADAFEAMPEQQFFKLIRLYLGEVQTPYNRQRLISQLASFIKNAENTQSILSYLDKKDITFLTAIYLIPNVSQQTLLDFFSGIGISDFYATLSNLSERLIIYSTKDKYSDNVCYHINPILFESLKPYLSIESVFPEHKIENHFVEDSFCLSQNFLAAFISYIRINKIGCKNDGTIKKNDFTKLEEIFLGQICYLQLLVNAFLNLSLLKDDGKSFILNNSRIEEFAKLSQFEQYSLLCVASCCHFSREGLRKYAQLLMNVLNSIPEEGFSAKEVLRLLVLASTQKENKSSFGAKSRFSQILEQTKIKEQSENSNQESNVSANLFEVMIESAISFGLLTFSGTTENGTKIYKKNKLPELIPITDNIPKVLNIDSSFTVTLMPGLSLDSLLPLLSFISIKKSGIVTEFEITRQSISVGFDEGWNPNSIFSELEKFINYELPQNLKINVLEWYKSYSSARLFSGYVLKVTDSNIAIAENNPKIKKYIKEKLAEGIYLLDISIDSDIKTFIKDSGLDFLGKIQQAEPSPESLSFPKLFENPSVLISLEETLKSSNKKTLNVKESYQKITKLEELVKQKEISQQQKESLLYKISNRLILSENQLNSTSIRTEILEADGMDFAGKNHLIEVAIKEDDMMELTFPSGNSSGFFTIVGKPLKIVKQVGESIVEFQCEPSKEIENFLISKITHLKRIHF